MVRAWWQRVRRWPPVVGDVTLVAAFAVVAVLEHRAHVNYLAGPLWLNVLLTGTVVVGLGFRRVAPVTVLLVSCAALGVPTLFVHHDFLVWSHALPVMIEVYSVARRRSLVVAVLGTALALAVTTANVLFDIGNGDSGFALGFLMFLPALGGGVVIRRNAERRAEIAAALATLEGEREAHERLALLDERTRVARELHDVVANAVSVMVVSARRASSAVADDPDAAEQAVLTLEASGRAATAELRTMLGLLRSPTAEVEPGDPAPGLGSLDGLVARMRVAGLDVRVEERGTRPALPAGFEVTLYRIVQEALTNVLKHAGPTRVDLRLGFPAGAGDPVSVDVVDRGPVGGSREPTPAVAGHGLVGMRERVGLLGGDLRCGPEGRGYAVRVRLPSPVAVAA